MKHSSRLLVFFVALALALAASSCIRLGRPAEQAAVTECGPGYKVFDIGRFDCLYASAADVYVTVGEADGKLRLEADDALIDRIEVSNRRGDLSIGVRGSDATAHSPRARVYVTAGTLREIYATSARVVLDRKVDAEIYTTHGSVEVDSLAVHAAR